MTPRDKHSAGEAHETHETHEAHEARGAREAREALRPQEEPLTVGRRPTDAALARFAASASADGRRLVVGAVITDDAGRLYLQRRTLSRTLFPGSWDLVGGHAEPGEGVGEALEREVFEETGWRLAALGPVVEVIDWEEGGVKRREVDLLVTVAGDLANPALEADKHSEGRWVTGDEVEAMAEKRAAAAANAAASAFGAAAMASASAAAPVATGSEGPDAWVFKVVSRAFELLRNGWVHVDVDGG